VASINIFFELWLPVRRLGGVRESIAPWQVTDRFESDPVVAIETPRPDFAGALIEYLIGFFATALTPTNDDATGDPASWIERWQRPPSPAEVRAAAERIPGLVEAHELEGDGPRFFQDRGPLESPIVNDVSALLIDSPGDQGVRGNTDLFVKRDRVVTLSRRSAAIALLTLQTYAPSGGRGNLTSLRGGGPLTTIVVAARPRAAGGADLIDTLWGQIWPNVPTRRALAAVAPDARADPPAIFPWLAPTRTSENKRGTAPGPEAHPLQAFFGLPRRLRLLFEPNPEGVACDLTGEVDEVVVRRFASRPYGVRYESWRHPLSPYYKAPDQSWRPVHPPSGGILYRHWPAYLGSTEERNAASAVAHFREARAPVLAYDEGEDATPFRLAAFGYEMDNMKPICWHQGVMPLFGSLPPAARERFDAFQARVVDAAEFVSSSLHLAVKRLMTERPKDLRGDTGWVRERFWRETERPFVDHLWALRLAARDDADIIPAQERWQLAIARHALRIFDSLAVALEAEVGDLERIVVARRDLHAAIHGDKVRQRLHLPVQARNKNTAKKKAAEESNDDHAGA
jgi:CRISPR system Cascade subunit CasA